VATPKSAMKLIAQLNKYSAHERTSNETGSSQ
jgi:hypothetical protein